MLKYDYINQFLRRNFFPYGGFVASYPYHFVLIPFATFLVLAVGFFRLSVISEVEYLYVPTNSKALEHRNAVEKLFPPVKENLDILRMTRLGASGNLILEPKDGGSIFRKSTFRSARQIDDAIKNITVHWKGNVFNYDDLCHPTANGECFHNRIFDLEDKMRDIIRKRTCIRYPIHNEGSFSPVIHALWLGGVTVDENSCVQDARAIRLSYYLSDATAAKKEVALKWEEAFLEETSRSLAGDVRIYRAISTMLDRDGSKFTKLVIPLLYTASPVVLIFAVGSCMTSDWITSKPWVGAAAFVSPLIATVGAFGLCLLCGMEYPEFNIAIPLLMLAIGLDDSFVLLSAWRRTDPKKRVQQRMGETYAEAAVSITVTSFTNLLSFLIGTTSPYRVHRIFFVFASLAVIFSYISQITFFGGILALSGYREEKGLHALLLIPVKKGRNDKAVGKYNHTLRDQEDSTETKELVTFYRDKLGKLLSTPWAKPFVIILYFFYLTGGIYGLTSLKVGLNLRSVFPSTSYVYKFMQKNFEHFSAYPQVVQVVINKNLDYSNPLAQKDVEEILNKFATSHKMAGRDMGASWLHSYLASVNDVRLWYSYSKFNISDPLDFMTALNVVFLRLLPFRPYSKDLLLNENKTEIIASRFFLISRNVLDGYEEAELISRLWNVADACKYPVYVHNHRFVVQSISSQIPEVCFRTIILSAFLAMAVFVVTVPSLLCVILVGIAVTSIELCVVGYMSLWNVGLDTVSSTGLIITTGLAIDYLAHVSYAYIICPKEDPNDKMREALHYAGHPVFQGCFSTILVICFFPIADAYAFVILFKILLLLMLFAGLNSLTLLPVCLASCEAALQFIKTDKRANETILKTIPESTCLMNSSYSKSEPAKPVGAAKESGR